MTASRSFDTLNKNAQQRCYQKWICIYLGEQILTNAVHNLLPRQATSTTCTLWLCVHDDLHSCLDLQCSEGQISVGVQAKNFWAFLPRQLLNRLQDALA